MNAGPSTHLSWAELACHDEARTPYPAEWRESRGIPLARVFEVIRQACGHKAITVLSGYRTFEYNAWVGGAVDSQHCQGRALDLQPPAGLTATELWRIVLALTGKRLPEVGGVGAYHTFVHVDIRPRSFGRLATWDERKAGTA